VAQFADDEYDEWRRPAGIFVLAPIAGPAAAVIHELQARYDPKLAAASAPHITLAGSSGVGPIRAGTPLEDLRRHLAPVARATPALALAFGLAQRFMQTSIISLPLDVHGPLRALHDRIARAGLPFGPARFTFTPHVTLNLYRTLTPDAERALLSCRVVEPAVIDSLVLTATDDPYPPRTVLVLRLEGLGGRTDGGSDDGGRTDGKV
jgi:2'-5' RNA ligase